MSHENYGPAQTPERHHSLQSQAATIAIRINTDTRKIMARFGSVDFDERILNAIRDDKLVIFAGAGVSMGSPSNLPGFWKLAKDIASGTGLKPTEPLDRFLGTLNSNGIDVHQRAIKHLSPEGSKPNDLHRNIIKLFRDSNRIRLITTNFDLLFEEACKELQNDDSFSEAPNIYRAPALPQGYDFNGIVYVHGALPQLSSHRAKDMVLTDADFGRAYLTEGWARSFLVDVFREFTVLFIGYSHNDTIMNYLARALPADRLSGRFALTDTDDKGKENWKLLGIEPITYNTHKGILNEHIDLYDSINQLADMTSRGILEWEHRIIELSKTPPTDNDALKGEINYILGRNDTTKLFAKHIKGKEWPAWLDSQSHLDSLFDTPALNERETILAKWLAERYTNTHPMVLFNTIFFHNLKINKLFWQELGKQISKVDFHEKQILEQWADVIFKTKPMKSSRNDIHDNESIFLGIAIKSMQNNSPMTIVKSLEALNDYDITIDVYTTEDNPKERSLAEYISHADRLPVLWNNFIKPNIESIANPLLEYISSHLTQLSSRLSLWNHACDLGDHRNEIESDEDRVKEDNNQRTISTLIDVARDSLKTLGDKDTELLESWISRLIRSDVPILRRLAVHATSYSKTRTPESQLKWIMDNNLLSTHSELHKHHEHHEVYCVAAKSYGSSREEIRQEFIQKILTIQVQSSDCDEKESKRLSLEAQFNWLTWLTRECSTCEIARTEFSNIKKTNPDINENHFPQFPDRYYGIEALISTPTCSSPWTKEQLLERSPRDLIKRLLAYENPTGRREFTKTDISNNIECSCTENPSWGIDLGNELIRLEKWSSYLWKPLFRGFWKSSLDKNKCNEVLNICRNKFLIKHQDNYISIFLEDVAKRQSGNFFNFKLDELAHRISLELWNSIAHDTKHELRGDWTNTAMEHTPGRLSSFWVRELATEATLTDEKTNALPDRYKNIFDAVINDLSEKGDIARTVLFMNIQKLHEIDREWTRTNLISLLGKQEGDTINQYAWVGFLKNEYICPRLSGDILPKILFAICEMEGHEPRNRLIQICARAIVLGSGNPNNKIIPHLFKNMNIDEMALFSGAILHEASELNSLNKRNKLWDKWLSQYLDNRAQNIPKPIYEDEIESISLGLSFALNDTPDAALLITRLPSTHLQKHYMVYENLLKHGFLKNHPSEAAKLLIHLSRSVETGDYIEDLKSAIDQVLRNIGGELRRKLEEAKALLP